MTSVPNFTTAAGPCDVNLNFSMRKPTFVQSPAGFTQATSGKTGIKLRINLVRETIRVVNPKKRDAARLGPNTSRELGQHLAKNSDISRERLTGYSKRELEAAFSLIEMANGTPSRKRMKVEPEEGVILTRKQRMVDPKHPANALLILSAGKAGPDVYDSDAEDLADDTAATSSNSELFRNVQWGPAASDTSNDADFPTEPEFNQFVPGRWERLADGTIKDQKHKLLVRLTSKDGRKLIFKNQPPKDWNDQRAITCLNKRVSQQIRRNTDVRFRPEVESYIYEERVWINAHLIKGKPVNGWKAFVTDFNAKFAGTLLKGCEASRPVRTHSSLAKEIDRFGKEFYVQGKVPQFQTKGGKKGNSKE